jgi:GPI ethanolamine phosphate transferase 2/3 subunit F
MSATIVAPKAQPPKPIDLLPNDIASVVAHLQPIVYLSSFYLIFPSIVVDPVATLKISLVPLAFLQAVYCIACLPAAGSATQPPKKTRKSTSGAVKKPADSLQKSNIFVSWD